MSDTDSFISEVNDEVRRDRLYAMVRRYGWIAALAIVLIVGGAAWSEYRKAQQRAAAEALGDGILAALELDDSAARSQALTTVSAPSQGGAAIVSMLNAAEIARQDDPEEAIAALNAIAVNGDVPDIYRQIASFKALTLQADTLDADTRRQQFDALAAPGQPLSLLAQEQLALIDISQGDTEAAIERYQAILQDAAVTSDLQQRALQVIVSLGGDPVVDGLPGIGN